MEAIVKKSQLLVVMALLTLAGIGITVVGFLDLAQEEHSTAYSFAQGWSQLWDLHAGFGWTMVIYCAFMLVVDLCIARVILKGDYHSDSAPAGPEVVPTPTDSSYSLQ
jgi:hypothetical protein